MTKLVRWIRGAMGIGLTWTAGWVVVGILLGTVIAIFDPGDIGPGEGPTRALPILAAVGFLSGIGFAVLLSVIERRHTLSELSIGRITMDAPFYPTVFARHGIAVLTPSDEERAWVHARYIGELLKGDFYDDTRLHFIALIQRMRDEHGVDGVILGGTELPLLLRTAAIADLPMLDTTALHVDAIVERLRAHEHQG